MTARVLKTALRFHKLQASRWTSHRQFPSTADLHSQWRLLIVSPQYCCAISMSMCSECTRVCVRAWMHVRVTHLVLYDRANKKGGEPWLKKKQKEKKSHQHKSHSVAGGRVFAQSCSLSFQMICCAYDADVHVATAHGSRPNAAEQRKRIIVSSACSLISPKAIFATVCHRLTHLPSDDCQYGQRGRLIVTPLQQGSHCNINYRCMNDEAGNLSIMQYQKTPAKLNVLSIGNLILVMAGIPAEVWVVGLTTVQLNPEHDSIIAIMISLSARTWLIIVPCSDRFIA